LSEEISIRWLREIPENDKQDIIEELKAIVPKLPTFLALCYKEREHALAIDYWITTRAENSYTFVVYFDHGTKKYSFNIDSPDIEKCVGIVEFPKLPFPSFSDEDWKEIQRKISELLKYEE